MTDFAHVNTRSSTKDEVYEAMLVFLDGIIVVGTFYSMYLFLSALIYAFS